MEKSVLDLSFKGIARISHAKHLSITRKQMQYALNITEYRAQKWLDELTAEEFSKYYCKKQGTTYVYYRYGWE